jgi:hypothetical protein
MGAVEEIHDRERKLIAVLAPRVVHYLRRREGADETQGPIEAQWGRVSFRIMLANTPVMVTLQVDP